MTTPGAGNYTKPTPFSFVICLCPVGCHPWSNPSSAKEPRDILLFSWHLPYFLRHMLTRR